MASFPTAVRRSLSTLKRPFRSQTRNVQVQEVQEVQEQDASTPPISTLPAPSWLSVFLQNLKDRYLSDVASGEGKGSEWAIVMGNEAGDLDTIASSVAYSWLETEVHHRQTLALIRFDHSDLVLRNENIYALSLAGLKNGAGELFYNSDIPNPVPFPSNRFALVDHNHLGPSFSTDNPSAQVIAVVDHHEDEGLYKDTADPRIISQVGSCSSLVARLCPPSIPPELATLLLCAILIDTGGLKPGGKAVEVDRDAAAFLAPLSTLASTVPQNFLDPDLLHDAPAIQDLATELEAKKLDISGLNAWDLLRRDYKEYIYRLEWADPPISIKAGLSTVPLGLETWITNGRLESQVQKWMDSRGIAVHGILTSYRDTRKPGKSGRGKHRKEQLWLVREGVDIEAKPSEDSASPATLDVDVLAGRLFTGLEASVELKLKRNKNFEIGKKKNQLPAGIKARVYDQKNTDASRKVTAPTLKLILESAGPLPKSVAIKDDRTSD